MGIRFVEKYVENFLGEGDVGGICWWFWDVEKFWGWKVGWGSNRDGGLMRSF